MTRPGPPGESAAVMTRARAGSAGPSQTCPNPPLSPSEEPAVSQAGLLQQRFDGVGGQEVSEEHGEEERGAELVVAGAGRRPGGQPGPECGAARVGDPVGAAGPRAGLAERLDETGLLQS